MTILEHSDLREGLPPCMKRRVEFEDRLAGLGDWEACGADHNRAIRPSRYEVQAGYAGQLAVATTSHPGISIRGMQLPTIFKLFTNDRAEAEAAWLRAEEWVRTGELPA